MAEVCTLDWHIAPFRADRWLDLWEPAAAKMPAYGASSWSLTRSIDDPLAFRQTSIWESRADFERYWYSEEIEAARASIIDLLRPAAAAELEHGGLQRVAGQSCRQLNRAGDRSALPVTGSSAKTLNACRPGFRCL